MKILVGRLVDCGKILFVLYVVIKIYLFVVLVILVGSKSEFFVFNFGCVCLSLVNVKDWLIWCCFKFKLVFVVGGDIFGVVDGFDSFKKDLTINSALE